MNRKEKVRSLAFGKTDNGRRVLGLCFFLAALILIAAGAWQGEALVVLRKSINICMECIGIG